MSPSSAANKAGACGAADPARGRGKSHAGSAGRRWGTGLCRRPIAAPKAGRKSQRLLERLHFKLGSRNQLVDFGESGAFDACRDESSRRRRDDGNGARLRDTAAVITRAVSQDGVRSALPWLFSLNDRRTENDAFKRRLRVRKSALAAAAIRLDCAACACYNRSDSSDRREFRRVRYGTQTACGGA